MDKTIIAVGCAGGRMVNHMAGKIKAEYLTINTDRRELEACRRRMCCAPGMSWSRGQWRG